MKDLQTTVNRLDVKIAIAVGICLLTAKFLPVIQYIAASFAAILCMQDNIKGGWKFGVNRMIVTAIGGAVGIAVILLDQKIQNEWVFIGMAVLGVLLTLWLCKLAKVPYINARIGTITFILVIMVGSGTVQISYAVLRLVGTFYGVVVALFITWFFSLLPRNDGEMEPTPPIGA